MTRTHAVWDADSGFILHKQPVGMCCGQPEEQDQEEGCAKSFDVINKSLTILNETEKKNLTYP